MVPVRLLVALALALEVVATVVVAERIGVLWTFAWWFATFVLGVLILRHAGARAWAGLRGTSRRGAAPGDTALLFLAGLLLAVPGVLSDAAGAVLLLPAARRVVKRQVARRVESRVSTIRGSVVRFRVGDDPVVQAGELYDEETGHTGHMPGGRPADDPDDPDVPPLPPR